MDELAQTILISYFFLINLAGFAAMGIDKRKAIKGLWRVSEKTLFCIAICGGSLGSILGMQAFRHKTKHLSFCVGMPVILILQAAIAYLIFF